MDMLVQLENQITNSKPVQYLASMKSRDSNNFNSTLGEIIYLYGLIRN